MGRASNCFACGDMLTKEKTINFQRHYYCKSCGEYCIKFTAKLEAKKNKK
ncbi:hypothetical protein [Clostridium sp.]|nr:hypothetical protein [Clostridium sp.]